MDYNLRIYNIRCLYYKLSIINIIDYQNNAHLRITCINNEHGQFPRTSVNVKTQLQQRYGIDSSV